MENNKAFKLWEKSVAATSMHLTFAFTLFTVTTFIGMAITKIFISEYSFELAFIIGFVIYLIIGFLMYANVISSLIWGEPDIEDWLDKKLFFLFLKLRKLTKKTPSK